MVAEFHVVGVVLAVSNDVRVGHDIKKVPLHAMAVRFQILKQLRLIAHVGQALKVVQELIPFVAPLRLLCCFFVAHLNPKKVPVCRFSIRGFLPPRPAPYRALHELSVVPGSDEERVPDSERVKGQGQGDGEGRVSSRLFRHLR